MTHYDKLVRVNFQHNYFQNQRCQVLNITPTPFCQKLIQNLGLFFKTMGSGFGVLYKRTDIPSQVPTILKQTPLKLSFSIYNNDPLFENYSDLPLSKPRKIFYFSNRSTSTNNDKIFLHTAAKLTQEELITVFPSTFNYEIIQEADPSSEKIKKMNINLSDEQGRVLKSETINLILQERLNENLEKETIYKGNYLIRLANKPFGKYILKGDEEIIEEFYIAETSPDQLWGVIDLYMTADGNDIILNPGQAEASVQFQDYSIFIEARKTIWQYLLINREEESFSDLELINGRAPVTFTSPETVSLPNGGSATLITIGAEGDANASLSLKEQGGQKFQLKFKKSSKEGATISHSVFLPVPNSNRIEHKSYREKISPTPSTITTEQQNDPSIFYSSMYVYL